MQFDRFAGEYEDILDRSISLSGESSGYFAEYKANYLQRLVPATFSGRVLEFGCGVGVLCKHLKLSLPNSQLDGFDVSQESIRKIDPSLSREGLFTSSFAELGDDYGLIVIANVMHHLPSEQRLKVIRNLAARLRPGGLLTIFEHNPANPVTRWVVERCPFDDDAVLLPPTETSAYLEHAMLTPRRPEYIIFMPRVLSWLRSLEPWLTRLPLGAQYVLVGDKNG